MTRYFSRFLIGLSFYATIGLGAEKKENTNPDYRAFLSTGLTLFPYEYNLSLGTRYNQTISFGYSLSYAENTETIRVPTLDQGTLQTSNKQNIDFKSNTNTLFLTHYFYSTFFTRFAIERREWHNTVQELSSFTSGDTGGGYEFAVDFDVVSTRYSVGLGYDFIFKQRYLLGFTALTYAMPEAGYKKSITVEQVDGYYGPVSNELQAAIVHSNLEIAKSMAKRAELQGPQIALAIFF